MHTFAATITLTGVMFIPMVMSIVVQKIHREQVIKPLGVSFKLNRCFSSLDAASPDGFCHAWGKPALAGCWVFTGNGRDVGKV